MVSVVSSGFAEEILWCSGAMSDTPLCVEFRGALNDRSKAIEIYGELSSVSKAPWPNQQYIAAKNIFEEANLRFDDEYFGQSSQLYRESLALFDFLRTDLNAAIAAANLILKTVTETKNFAAAIAATERLESWDQGDFSQERSLVQSMIRDEERINSARRLIADENYENAKAELSELETSLYNEDSQLLTKTLKSISRKKKLSRLIRDGLQAIDEKNYESAKVFLLGAQQLAPASSTVLSNLRLIGEIEKSIEVEGLKRSLDAYKSAQQFKLALATVTRLETIDQTSTYEQQKTLLEHIVSLSSTLESLDQQMTSLSSVKLRKACARFIATVDSTDLTKFGINFQRKYEQFKSRYQTLSTKISVTLRSDGKSLIILRPGGKLNKFKEITLKVYPGNYQLIARCSGVKEKIVDVLVKENAQDRTEYIACL
jgi:hypothetical protein